MASTMATPKTFHRFPLLPTEIRHIIWRHALPGPRIVRVKSDAFLSEAHSEASDSEDSSDEEATIAQSKREYGFFSSTHMPAIMRACREARIVAQAKYEYVFAWERDGARGGVWIDFATDILFLDELISELIQCFAKLGERGENSDHRFARDLVRVRSLALCDIQMARWPLEEELFWDEDMWCELLACFGGIERLVMVCDHGNVEEGKEGLVFMDVENLEALLVQYRQVEYDPQVDEYWSDASWGNRYQGEIEQDGLIRRMECILKERSDWKWTMPWIERKIITTPRRVAELEEAKRMYEKKREIYYSQFVANR